MRASARFCGSLCGAVETVGLAYKKLSDPGRRCGMACVSLPATMHQCVAAGHYCMMPITFPMVPIGVFRPAPWHRAAARAV